MDGRRFELVEVVVERGGHRLLDGATGWIPDHGVTVVAGPSGSGKSTLLRLLNRLEVPSAGEVLQWGRPLAETDPLAHRRQVGMVFQQPVALPGSVAEDLRVAAPTASDSDLQSLLGRVGLESVADRFDAPSRDLSGGELQRLAIARTLLTGPEAICFDEPTSALDPAATAGIEDLVSDLVADGLQAIWVTHDLDQLRRLAHQVLIVVDGRIAQQGHRDEVLAAPGPEAETFLSGGGR